MICSEARADYSVAFSGAPKDLEAKLVIVSQLKSGTRDYSTRAALARAARQDAARIADALSSAGYYSATASPEITDVGDDYKVTFEINAGGPFRITDYIIEYQDNAVDRPTTIDAAGIEATQAADGASLGARQNEFLQFLLGNGFPRARNVGRKVIANFEDETAVAVFSFQTGEHVRFGDVEISGDARIAPDHIRAMTTWESGEQFDQTKLIAFRDRLGDSGLFADIDVFLGDAPNDNGETPVIAALTERKRRTIGAGASFSTAEGPGARLFFENRNLFGRAESLRIGLEASAIAQSITFDAYRPLLELPGSLFASFAFTNETTEAFDARTINLSAGASKTGFGGKLDTRGALALETSGVTDDTGDTRTFFVSTPLSAVWDSEDNLLNPTKGAQVSFQVTPYTGTDTFTQGQISARSRIQFGNDGAFTLAARGRLGATVGTDFSDLPFNKRYFAGGGGSVRGFG